LLSKIGGWSCSGLLTALILDVFALNPQATPISAIASGRSLDTRSMSASASLLPSGGFPMSDARAARFMRAACKIMSPDLGRPVDCAK
jgi:hypothetical protein